jgi:hypothetical protein
LLVFSPADGWSPLCAFLGQPVPDVPDLSLSCDGVRVAGDHMVYLWTFTGHHSGTKAPLTVVGWEEWDLDASHKVKASRGWFDGEDYARQVSAQ